MLSEPELSYRFGWRVLLPIKYGSNVLLLGFNDQEKCYLKRALPEVSVVGQQSPATDVIVNDLDPKSFDDLIFTHLKSISVIGSKKNIYAWRRLVANKFAETNIYGMLPPNNPRVILPLGHSDWIIKGLALHSPGRWFARTAVFGLKILARIGIESALHRKMLFIATDVSATLPGDIRINNLNGKNKNTKQASALYLGSPDEFRKTVILPLSDTLSTILKHGDTQKANNTIRNEAETLKILSQTELASHVPILHDLVDRNDKVTLHQEYRPRVNRLRCHMERASLNFLVRLSLQGRSTRKLKDVLSNLRDKSCPTNRDAVHVASRQVWKRLDELAEQGVKIIGYRSHGDFASWNYEWTRKGFFVFDWEESQAWDIAFEDVFYQIIGPALHISKPLTPASVETKAIDSALVFASNAGLPVEDIRMYWAIWLLKRISRGTMPLYEQCLENVANSWK